MYEYAIMSKTVALKPLAAKKKEEILDNLETALWKVMDTVHKSLRTYEGGGWEILSHDLTKLEHHFLITFLIRRQK